MSEQSFENEGSFNPAADYVSGVAQGMKRSHDEQKAQREQKRRQGFLRRAHIWLFGESEDDDPDAATGQPASRPDPGSPAPARFVNAETFEDDAIDDGIEGPVERMAPMDALKARRLARIEKARVGRPFHEVVMLFFLRIWLLVGPVAFVVLTAAEVAYILTHLVEPSDTFAQYTIWGGALFIEFAMMFTTFGLGIKRHELAEHREVYGQADPSQSRLVNWGTWMWLAFALINVIGQTAFLADIVGQSSQDMRLLWVFVISRVIGFILGDACTAFFLGQVDSNDVRLMARAEHERGKLYTELTEAEGKRKLLEAEADSRVQLLEIKVEQERADAFFLAQLKRQTFTRVLELSGGAPDALPAPTEDAPLTGEFRQLGTSDESAPGGNNQQVRLRRLDRQV